MKTMNFWAIFMIGVMMILSLFGCGKKKYRLSYDGGFESEKPEYAAGEKVTVYYPYLATDTDYRFYSNDVDMKQDYDEEHGYIFTFTMPAHDVKISCYSHNSMVYDPTAGEDPTEEKLIAQIEGAEMVFDYYDAATGTDGYDGYDEYTLYRLSDGGMILARYSSWPDSGKTAHACTVTDDVLHECLKVVDEFDMKNWKDGFPIDGAYYSVKFLQGGEVIKASSENMPEDGQKAFGSVQRVLDEAWSIYYSAGD